MLPHPIYADVPLLMSLATGLVAATDHASTEPLGLPTRVTGSVESIVPTLADLIRAYLDLDGAAPRPENRPVLDSQFALRVYERLRSEPSRLFRPEQGADLMSIPPDALIEATGTLGAGFLGRLVDYLEAACLAQHMADILEEQELSWSPTGETAFTRRRKLGRQSAAERFRDLLGGELRRSALIQAVLRGGTLTAPSLVVRLRSVCVDRLQLADMFHRVVTVVGKVVRLVPAGQSLSLSSDLGSGLLRSDYVEGFLKEQAANPNVSFDPGESHLAGPTAVLAPALIFV